MNEEDRHKHLVFVEADYYYYYYCNYSYNYHYLYSHVVFSRKALSVLLGQCSLVADRLEPHFKGFQRALVLGQERLTASSRSFLKKKEE